MKITTESIYINVLKTEINSLSNKLFKELIVLRDKAMKEIDNISLCNGNYSPSELLDEIYNISKEIEKLQTELNVKKEMLKDLKYYNYYNNLSNDEKEAIRKKRKQSVEYRTNFRFD